jgi:membrane-associated phospholipid phosphatase
MCISVKRLFLVLVVSLAVGLCASAWAPLAHAAEPSAVRPWIELDLEAISSHSTNPPRASRALAHLSSAMYLAALAGREARDDAVAGAASTVLVHFYPDEPSRIDALADRLADVSSPAFARGRLVGRLLVTRAKSDHSDAVWTGSAPVGPGYWVPTPPAFVYPPLEPLAGTWRTWNLRDGSQLRPGPPPAYAGAQFLAELQEVYGVSQSLTAEQKRIAEYWADGAGTVTPPGHWNRIALELVGPAGWSTLRESLLFSALNTAQADAFIACWDAKYAYWSLRPVTAVRRLIDPSWLSYIVTPPFPSYVSGHSTTSGAAATVLGGFFPNRAGDLNAMAEEAAISRLYGGIHFRSDNEAGLELGRSVGAVAVRAYDLQPE